MVSARALSYESPTLPTEGSTPASAKRSVYLIETYWAESSGRRNTLTGVAMNIRKRRSDRSGRVRLFSPGRPPVAGREERRRFWAAIAAGAASEDAAAGVGVPQAVGTRWFRKAGGMPPSMFGLLAKPLSGRYLSFTEREEIALLRVQGYSIQEVARRLGRAGGIDNLQRAAAQRRHPKRRPRLSCDDSTMARRARCSPPQAGEACAQRDVKNLCRGTVGWRRRGSERDSCSRSGRVLEKPSVRTTEGSAMGKRLEPGADRLSPAGGLPR